MGLTASSPDVHPSFEVFRKQPLSSARVRQSASAIHQSQATVFRQLEALDAASCASTSLSLSLSLSLLCVMDHDFHGELHAMADGVMGGGEARKQFSSLAAAIGVVPYRGAPDLLFL
jgi:hypothetical protein